MLKKIICTICCAAIAAFFTACGTSQEHAENTPSESTTKQAPVTSAAETEAPVTSTSEA